MIDKALDWFIPHICSSCGDVGSLLCESCEEDIIEDSFALCVCCLKPCFNDNLCSNCQRSVAYKLVYVVGWRREALKRLINSYKFERSRAGAASLADLLDRRLPILPPGTIVTYVPTINAHIRQRGFDHTRLLANNLAQRRDLKCQSLLRRREQSVQHGATKHHRLAQAKSAFELIDKEIKGPVLLIDDIFTTGATVDEATKLLVRRHKQPVILAIIARQPLDDLADL